MLSYKTIQSTHAGDFYAGIRSGRRALAIGEAQADPGIQAVAHWYLGCAYMARGECRESVEHFTAAFTLIPADLRRERFGQAGIPAAVARCFLSMALGDLGRFAEGFERVREGARRCPWPPLPSGRFPRRDGRPGDTPHRVPPRGPAAGREPLSIDAALQRGHGAGEVPLVELQGSQAEEAARIAHDGLATARQRGERGVEDHLLRLLGDIAAHPDRLDADAAEPHYRGAMLLAQELGLSPLTARCHFGLGLLYRGAGMPQKAREHLTAAVTMFGQMEMRYWLEQSTATMTDLA